MALSESEELELLTLEREKAQAGGAAPKQPIPKDFGIKPEDSGSWDHDIAGNLMKGAKDVLQAPANLGNFLGGHLTDAMMAGSKSADGATMRPEAAAAAGAGVNALTQLGVGGFGGGAVGKLFSPAVERMGLKLMGSALKPGKAAAEKGERAIQTMVDKGYNVTHGGVAKMNDRVAELNGSIEKIISTSGKDVDRAAVVKALDQTMQKASKGGLPEHAMRVVKEAREEFERNYPAKIPVQLAQEIKQSIGKRLGNAAYGMGLKPEAEQDSLKALQFGLKEEIARLHPEVKNLNKEESDLLNALVYTRARTHVSEGSNPATLAATLAHSPGQFIGAVLNSSQWAKSVLARAAYHGKEIIPATAGAATGAAAETAINWDDLK